MHACSKGASTCLVENDEVLSSVLILNVRDTIMLRVGVRMPTCVVVEGGSTMSVLFLGLVLGS